MPKPRAADVAAAALIATFAGYDYALSHDLLLVT